jgi:hypothetical protein
MDHPNDTARGGGRPAGRGPKPLPALALALLLWLAPPLPAQEHAGELPEEVESAVVDFFNDPRRARYTGPTRIEADRTLRSDVAVLEGPLVVAGRIHGSVVAVDAEVELLPGAVVTGDILVVGGAVHGMQEATVGGEVLIYPQGFDYRVEGDRIVRIPRVVGRQRTPRDSPAHRWGWSDFLITTGRSYNRVEGLPITFGPRIQTAGSNPQRLHALATYRTDAGLPVELDRMGYYLRGEQFLGGRRHWRVGATLHSLIDPIEEWQLTDLESGLATFLFHRDYRDHYERQGTSLFTTWEPRGRPYQLTADVRWERHGTVAPGNPWTLLENARPWRPQPLVAEGRLRLFGLQGSYDTRSQAIDPATGWHLHGRLERSFDGELSTPPAFREVGTEGAGIAALPVARDRFTRLTAGMIDVRRYNRIDPRSRLNLRLVAGGTLDGRALPPQRQHALGGEGSLPGYDHFRLDCGAREGVVFLDEAPAGAREREAPFFPAYGCDAFTLVQAEYRGKLAFRFRLDRAPWEDRPEEEEDARGWGFGWDVSPDWTVFLDAGRGWAAGRSWDERTAVDVGVGVLVDRFGVYLAAPLRGGSGVNAFVRLGPRF